MITGIVIIGALCLYAIVKIGIMKLPVPPLLAPPPKAAPLKRLKLDPLPNGVRKFAQLVSLPGYMIVGFSTSKHLLSGLIRFVTRSSVSHAFMRFRVAGHDVTIGADHRGVHAESWERFKKTSTVISQYVVDLPWQPLIPEVVADLGAGYDIPGFFGQAVVMFGTVFGKHWDNPWQKEDQWYCSEFCANLLSLAGESLPFKPSVITPEILLGLMAKSPHATELPPSEN